MPDIFQMLHTDHDTMLLLFRRLEQEGEAKNVLEELRRTFDGHTEAEEHTLYAMLKGDDQVGGLVEQGFVEHHAVRTLMNELSTVPMEPQRRVATISVMRQMVEMHVAKEEGPVFTRAAAIIPRIDAEELVRVFNDERRRAA